jgi:hypothetical protein
VWRQLAHALDDRLLVGLAQRGASQGGGGLQGSRGDGAEVVVAARRDRQQRGLDELLEPGLAGSWVAEGASEVGVEGAEVEQGLVDVEDVHRRHGGFLSGLLMDLVARPMAATGPRAEAGSWWDAGGPRRLLPAVRLRP